MTSIVDLSSSPLLRVDAANGVTSACGRFGAAETSPPLVFLHHVRGNVDNGDPALIDPIAARREVVVFDNSGVAGSSGTTPDSVAQMATDATESLDALELEVVDRRPTSRACRPGR